MALIVSAKATSDDHFLPEKPAGWGYMDSRGVFWHGEGGLTIHGFLWLAPVALGVARSHGWRLLFYERGRAMVKVERSQADAARHMETEDD